MKNPLHVLTVGKHLPTIKLDKFTRFPVLQACDNSYFTTVIVTVYYGFVFDSVFEIMVLGCPMSKI